MGKVHVRMAARTAGRRRERQDRRDRKKTRADPAPRGAEVFTARRQATIGRMREVRIQAFAKINLRLDILGKRADGYHELRTIFQTVSLHDELRLRTTKSSEISLTINGNDELAREPVKKNLAYRAVDALRRELKIRRGIELELHKTIPSGGGVGGGSSNAAAAA